MTSARRLADYTLDDWDSLDPVEGQRIELVDGLFRVSAAPAPRHQRAGDRIREALAPAVEPLGWEVFTAIGVRVRPGLGYIPDVVVCRPVTDDEVVSITADTVALVVEVVSPSSRKIDRLEKPVAYAAAGIPAYWRVEMVRHKPLTILCYQLDRGVYRETDAVESGAPREITLPMGVAITLDVDRIDRRGQD